MKLLDREGQYTPRYTIPRLNTCPPSASSAPPAAVPAASSEGAAAVCSSLGPGSSRAEWHELVRSRKEVDVIYLSGTETARVAAIGDAVRRGVGVRILLHSFSVPALDAIFTPL
jgi:hypothetical protein